MAKTVIETCAMNNNVNLIYDNLNLKTAVVIAKNTTKFIGDSLLGFKDVLPEEASFILKNADRKE